MSDPASAPGEVMSFLEILSAQISAQQGQISALMEEMRVLRSSHSRPATPIPASSSDPAPVLASTSVSVPASTLAKSEKIADPPLFSGKKPAELTSFLFLLRLKLSGNADRYPTEDSRASYAISRLSERALD